MENKHSEIFKFNEALKKKAGQRLVSFEERCAALNSEEQHRLVERMSKKKRVFLKTNQNPMKITVVMEAPMFQNALKQDKAESKTLTRMHSKILENY